MQTALYEGQKDDTIVQKMWLALTHTSVGEAIPTKTRGLLVEILSQITEEAKAVKAAEQAMAAPQQQQATGEIYEICSLSRDL